MTPTDTLALVDALRELVFVILQVLTAGLAIALACLVTYLAGCAFSALKG